MKPKQQIKQFVSVERLNNWLRTGEYSSVIKIIPIAMRMEGDDYDSLVYAVWYRGRES